MAMIGYLQTACLVAFAVLVIGAGWQDLRTTRIPNGISLATVATFTVWAAAGIAVGRMASLTVAISMACSLVVFAIAAAGFGAGVIGGGDVKLLSAASLFAGPSHLVDFLLVTAIAGGVLGLAFLAGVPIGGAVPATDATDRRQRRSGLPYGPAIAAGGLWVAATLYAW